MVLRILFFFTFLSCQGKQHTLPNNPSSFLDHEIGILTTDRGVIHIKFLTKDAPNTVKRIKQLINQKFYDGIQFHRVIPNFVIQAGDPSGTGVGGSGTNIKAEFNSELNVKGTVAMARLGHDIDSADSQFYIALSTLPHLDNKYTVFGKVIIGLDVLDKIQKGDKIKSFKLK